MAVCQNGAVNSAPQDPDTYEQIRNDLDTLTSKLDSLKGAFSYLAGMEGEPAGLFFSFMNLTECLKGEATALVGRMFEVERGGPGMHRVKAVQS